MCRSTFPRRCSFKRRKSFDAIIRASRCSRSWPISPSRSRCRPRPRGWPIPDSSPDRPGNFEPHEACAFLRHAGRVLGRGAALIIGVDLVKDASILNAAYNDAAGLTAKFNLNLLARINRELDGDFDLASFDHRAFYNRERHRIEMHLVSKKRQKVSVAGRVVEFRAGETIHTENSYKYPLEYFTALARGSGWVPVAAWTDAGANFSIHALVFEDR